MIGVTLYIPLEKGFFSWIYLECYSFLLNEELFDIYINNLFISFLIRSIRVNKKVENEYDR